MTAALVVASLIALSACTPDFSGTSGGGSSPRTTPSTSTPDGGPDPASTAAVTAAVTIAGVDVDGHNLTVAGFVSGVSESGGTCEFVVSSSTTGVVQKMSNSGEVNVKTTSCGSLKFPIADFTRGGWNVVLNYSSPTSQVSSQPLETIVP
jgi:hypothetical protein